MDPNVALALLILRSAITTRFGACGSVQQETLTKALTLAEDLEALLTDEPEEPTIFSFVVTVDCDDDLVADIEAANLYRYVNETIEAYDNAARPVLRIKPVGQAGI